MATAAKLITVADFLERPDVAGGYEELRRGEVVMVAWPKQRHNSIQRRIRIALERAIGDAAIVDKEIAFRARPEYELRRADVAVVSFERWELAEVEGYISGAPEIVIEVESPSNTASEFREKEDLCLANGAVEFWVVYPDQRAVTVSQTDGTRTYRDGEEIELRSFEGKRVSVSAVRGPVAEVKVVS